MKQSWFEREGMAGAPLLAVLLVALLLAGTFAYQALDAARSHRKVTEGALRDYAAFAVWQFGQALEIRTVPALTDALFRATGTLLSSPAPVRAGRVTPDLPRLARRIESELSWCVCNEAIHDIFALDFTSGDLSLHEPVTLSNEKDWLIAKLPERSRESEAARALDQITILQRPDGRVLMERFVSSPQALVVSGVGRDQNRALVYTLVRDPDGNPQEAFGFVVDVPEFARAATRDVLAHRVLLPPSLTRGAPNEEILWVSVLGPDSSLIYRSAGSPGGAPTATEAVAPPLGQLLASVAVRPEFAEQLVIGGLPQSRVPLLLALLFVTLAVTLAAVRQIRRRDELFRLRGEFISGVSHELRTPLTQIRLFSELLESERLTGEQRRRSIRVIGEEARRLTFLVENILSFSRVGRGQDFLNIVELDLGSFVPELVESFKPLAESAAARLEVHLCPGLVARADPDAMRQVLLNLLDNSIKYGPSGQTITVGARGEGSKILLWVEDEGPGIPPNEREHVWLPYHRLRREQEAVSGGSGIGLSIVRELIHRQDGRICVTDGAMGGARFEIALPASGSSRCDKLPEPHGAMEDSHGAHTGH